MENSELIVVKQLPIIEEQLKTLSEEIDKKEKYINDLVCTEETVKEVKQIRADLGKEFKEFEMQRKLVKEKVLEPYMKFEDVYKVCVSDKYKNIDMIAKTKIDNVENELKANKKLEVESYFNEYLNSKNIDFVTFEKANINVTLSASMKSLKEQAKAFIDKISDDLNLIDTQEHKAEILVEYKKSLNVSNAITTVSNRFKAIEEEKAKEEQKVVHIEMNENHEITKESYEQLEKIFNKPLERPIEEKQEEKLTLAFKVTDTRTRLRELKEYMDKGGYIYE